MQPIIEAQGLTKLYRRGREDVQALKDVSFCINKGEFTAITGPSGSGKTTLLNLLGCMDEPTSGSLHIAGQQVDKLSDHQRTHLRREHIGFVFQHFGLIPTLTVEENVQLPSIFSRRKSQPLAGGLTAKQNTADLLVKVGLSQRRKHRPHELSGGEMQRVAIARALFNAPPLLLADEPTGNLDSTTGNTIIELFQQLNREGLTIVVVTHNPDLAAVCSRQLRLSDGQLQP
jgi:putative ABC transport system ATP-binding protein